jgi:hypothetical protein
METRRREQDRIVIGGGRRNSNQSRNAESRQTPDQHEHHSHPVAVHEETRAHPIAAKPSPVEACRSRNGKTSPAGPFSYLSHPPPVDDTLRRGSAPLATAGRFIGSLDFLRREDVVHCP